MYFLRVRNKTGSGRKNHDYEPTAAVVKRQNLKPVIRTVVANDESNLRSRWEETLCG